MENSKKNFIRSFLLILLTFLSGHAGAADFADISAEGGKVYWVIDPAIAYSSADLRVSAPDGSVSSQLVDDPAVPSYPMEGESLQNGRYNYELVLNPLLATSTRDARKSDGSADDAKLDENGRPISAVQLRSGGVLPEAPMQSGSFFIQDGALVSPDVEE